MIVKACAGSQMGMDNGTNCWDAIFKLCHTQSLVCLLPQEIKQPFSLVDAQSLFVKFLLIYKYWWEDGSIHYQEWNLLWFWMCTIGVTQRVSGSSLPSSQRSWNGLPWRRTSSPKLDSKVVSSGSQTPWKLGFSKISLNLAAPPYGTDGNNLKETSCDSGCCLYIIGVTQAASGSSLLSLQRSCQGLPWRTSSPKLASYHFLQAHWCCASCAFLKYPWLQQLLQMAQVEIVWAAKVGHWCQEHQDTHRAVII